MSMVSPAWSGRSAEIWQQWIIDPCLLGAQSLLLLPPELAAAIVALHFPLRDAETPFIYKRSIHDPLHAGRLFGSLALGVLVVTPHADAVGARSSNLSHVLTRHGDDGRRRFGRNA